ncbi:spore germination protein [Alteribacillus sp. HJP-4]|uniref:spore germination protein n=1 Tax=Alteribacillus sp. HJP-4 TaxID=2775394 RepID=UPI0035CCE4ED
MRRKRWKKRALTTPPSSSAESKQQPKTAIEASCEENIKKTLNVLHHSSDVKVSYFLDLPVPFAICWLLEIVDNQKVNESVIHPLVNNTDSDKENKSPVELADSISAPYHKITDSIEEAAESLIHGHVIVWLEGDKTAYCISGLGSPTREITEPSSQTVIRGPRLGFVESLQINTALLRRQIRNTNLRFQSMYIGSDTQTEVQISYLTGKVDENVLKELYKRLHAIRAEEIYESGMLEEYLGTFGRKGSWYSPFPLAQSVERPDAVASAIQEGRIAVLVDNTPFVLIYPSTFFQFFQSAEDYYQRFDFSTLIRMLRFLAYFISLYLPSLYVAITTFNPELIATDLLVSLSTQREGIPFPAFIEALLMEITFEILREGGIRMPRTIGPAISIVGAIVLGESAVMAGLVSPAVVIVVSLTAISSFVAPSYDFSISARMLRFFMMLFAASYGLFGILFFSLILLIHLVSLDSMGKPYMSPLAPFDLKGQKDTLLRLPFWLRNAPIFKGKTNKYRENVE